MFLFHGVWYALGVNLSGAILKFCVSIFGAEEGWNIFRITTTKKLKVREENHSGQSLYGNHFWVINCGWFWCWF